MCAVLKKSGTRKNIINSFWLVWRSRVYSFSLKQKYEMKFNWIFYRSLCETWFVFKKPKQRARLACEKFNWMEKWILNRENWLWIGLIHNLYLAQYNLVFFQVDFNVLFYSNVNWFLSVGGVSFDYILRKKGNPGESLILEMAETS